MPEAGGEAVVWAVPVGTIMPRPVVVKGRKVAGT